VPTARELLDQADALMRRNRPASATPADEGIPTLMDAVQPPDAASAPREAPSARALVREEAVNDLEDVPLLTDAVEEIEAPSILDEPPEEDDPAAWDDTLTGAHTIFPAAPLELPAPQVHGEAPAVGVLPEEWGATPPAHAGPMLAVETIEIPPPQEEVAEPVAIEPMAFDVSEEPIAAGPLPPEALAPELPAPGTPAYAPSPGSAEETLPNRLADASDETQPATPFEWPAGEAAAFHAPPVPAAPAADEARWSALAEEIRMQVLQRIDLFTDTGLREQLAARMQPIVDRASADLVATINQHVGVLLRAYVAEAIEREIERWRAERR